MKQTVFTESVVLARSAEVKMGKKAKTAKPANPRVYLDVSVGGKKPQRIVIEVRDGCRHADEAPHTSISLASAAFMSEPLLLPLKSPI